MAVATTNKTNFSQNFNDIKPEQADRHVDYSVYDVDDIIEKLLLNSVHNPAAKQPIPGSSDPALRAALNINKNTVEPVTEDEIRYLILQTRYIFMSQPMLIEITLGNLQQMKINSALEKTNGTAKSAQNEEISPPSLAVENVLHVCGDIHGQYADLLRLFLLCKYPGYEPSFDDVTEQDESGSRSSSKHITPTAAASEHRSNKRSIFNNFLFLGDYVDRGRQSLETILLLFAYKIKYVNNFFLLRGNHECSSINRIYGFFDECKRRYGLVIGESNGNSGEDGEFAIKKSTPIGGVKLWKMFTDTFNCLPVAAVIEDKILCMHGGLSPELRIGDISSQAKSSGEQPLFCNYKQQINSILRPTDVPDTGLLCDLLWSDPIDVSPQNARVVLSTVISNLNNGITDSTEQALRNATSILRPGMSPCTKYAITSLVESFTDWASNDRGVSYTFGVNVLREFLQSNNLDLICRAHQVVEEGYLYNFLLDMRAGVTGERNSGASEAEETMGTVIMDSLASTPQASPARAIVVKDVIEALSSMSTRGCVTVFSAPNYCNEFDNKGGIMCVRLRYNADEGVEILCSFKQLLPQQIGKMIYV